MGKKGLVKIMMVVVAVALVTVGCAKKPKINLAELRDGNSVAASNMPGAGENVDGFSVDGQFANDGQPSIPGGAGADQNAGNAGNSGNGANGNWVDAKAPVNIGGASDFLKNATAWDEKVYFAYNSAEIDKNERQKLDRLAENLSKNNQGVIIEGHCDERGSSEYNRALSERRALAIRKYLSTLGIDNARMLTLGYGIDRPEIPNAKNEKEHSMNRRGQFLLGDRK